MEEVNNASGPSKISSDVKKKLLKHLQRTRASTFRAVDTVATNFLHNFDPEQSEREKRKLNRRLHHGNKKTVLYDDKGIHIATTEDMCDCLEKSCMGCHFPCPKCSSAKCGHECRNNRKWMYESIENEGSDRIVRNPLNAS